MRGLNKVILIGNLGNEPEIKTLEGNVKVARFSLATSESYKDKNGDTQTDTEWHTIIAWRSLAELVENYLHKGSTIYIEGKIKTRSYEDKEGIKRYVTEIIAKNLVMLDKKTNEKNDI
ncbi:MAG: single-stranded DNA-binding protein [Microscillaceae bacterium]|nr:single-stranded DNA-binding protein [Microscillaceae bacterium]